MLGRKGRSTAAQHWLAAVVAAAAAGGSAGVAAQDGRVSLHAGVERTTGDYGGADDVDDTYVPLILLYERDRLAFRLTVPYLEVEFIEPGADDEPSTAYTESGLGDVVLGLTVYDVLRSADGSVAMDLTGRIELPTADEDQGLGTGETDYSLQGSVYKFLGSTTLVGTLGYKVHGEPADFTIEDTWRASAGALYRFSTSTTGGIFLDYRESSVPGAPSIREASVSLSRRLDERWRLQGYLLRGLSDSSLDWGAGLSVRWDL